MGKSTSNNVGPQQLVKTFGYSPTPVSTSDEGTGNNNSFNIVPTAVDWVYEDPSHMVTGYSNAACIIYDIETGKSVVRMDTLQDNSNEFGAITCVVSHPTLPLTITAHEDRHIRFFDNKTGKLAHAMVAHLDAVTSLAVDVNGLYLISGSHDCSVRLWNLETKTCVQEIAAHRKKFDESIFDVAFHPSRPFIASAGADALAKVFVWSHPNSCNMSFPFPPLWNDHDKKHNHKDLKDFVLKVTDIDKKNENNICSRSLTPSFLALGKQPKYDKNEDNVDDTNNLEEIHNETLENEKSISTVRSLVYTTNSKPK